MSERDESAIRARLLEVLDEIRALAPGDLAQRHELASEADRLRSELARAAGDDVETARRGWAERAGRKGLHAEDPAAAEAAIVSPSEGGAGAI